MNNALRMACILLVSTPALATVQLNANRVVYNAADSDAKITIKNKESREYLIQSWIDNNNQPQAKIPFIVTPPLFKMGAESENVVQIIYSGQGLPRDRESLSWLDIKAIPSMTDAEKNTKDKIMVAVVNRLKLIYRPSGLAGNNSLAIEKLQWSQNGQGMSASNNTPYYVILNKISLNGHDVQVNVTDNNTVIAPFSSKTYPQRAGTVKIDWSGMNDYGVASTLYSVTLH